jgi:hypothetical protein
VAQEVRKSYLTAAAGRLARNFLLARDEAANDRIEGTR